MAAGIAQEMLGSEGNADKSVAITKLSAPKAHCTTSGKGNKICVPIATANP